MIKSKEKLALLGGPKSFDEEILRYNTIGKEEIKAATKVIKTGNLSQFLGEYDQDFFGGPKVKEFEENCARYFGVEHAITVNSWSSGLTAAVGAIGIEPGDEVIVPTFTMTATATAVLHWNAIPVFADIETDTFNIDPNSILKNLTKYTKAIISVDMLGHSANMDPILDIAKKNKLKVISDTAQAIGSYYKGKYSGTLADIGGYSLNYHKLIHTGEGGILVTNDDDLALRLKLIRNHAEAVVNGFDIKNLTNMVGYNFRMGEIEAAIGIEQLKKLDDFVEEKRKWANFLIKELHGLPGLRLPITLPNCSHCFYAFPMLIDPNITKVSKKIIYKALLAEGVPALASNFKTLSSLPIYQNKIAYGSKGYPWTNLNYKGKVSYNKGITPIAEKIFDENFLNLGLSLYKFDQNKLKKIVKAFNKVWENLDKLKLV